MDEIEIKTLKEQEKLFETDSRPTQSYKPSAGQLRNGRAGVVIGLLLITIGLFALVLPLWQPVAWHQFWWLIFLVKPLFYGFGRIGTCHKPSL